MVGKGNGGRAVAILDDAAKIVVNSSTRQTTLFSALIARGNSEFLDPFTLTAGDSEN